MRFKFQSKAEKGKSAKNKSSTKIEFHNLLLGSCCERWGVVKGASIFHHNNLGGGGVNKIIGGEVTFIFYLIFKVFSYINFLK